MTEPRRRRTQAERSSATRQILLDATIECLFQHGYGATTTMMITDVAGVSRGALLHQFPSKADLMTFVVEAVFEQEVGLYRELLNGIDHPQERIVAYPEAVWKVLNRPAGVAVLEILQGTRSDAALAEKLAPVVAKIEENVKSLLQQELHRKPSVALLHLIVAAVRGLSIRQVIASEGEGGEESIKLLQKLMVAGMKAGVIAV